LGRLDEQPISSCLQALLFSSAIDEPQAKVLSANHIAQGKLPWTDEQQPKTAALHSRRQPTSVPMRPRTMRQGWPLFLRTSLQPRRGG